jgi:hypothetical protein
LKCKVFCITIFDRLVDADTRIVDDDVNLELAISMRMRPPSRFFYLSNEITGAVGGTQVSLDDKRLGGKIVKESSTQGVRELPRALGSVV